MAACVAGESEAAEALGRAFDAPLVVKAGSAAVFQSASMPEDLSGPGLVIVLHVGATAAITVFSASHGLLPSWCAAPDPTGKAKLSTLAQELSMILLPESLMSEEQQAIWVQNLADAVSQGGVRDGAALIPLTLSAGTESRGTAYLIWPAATSAAITANSNGTAANGTTANGTAAPAASAPKLETASAASPQKTSPAPAKAPASPANGDSVRAPQKPELRGQRELPPYTRSLLRIRVPVVVTLAEKRQPLGKIVELSPGAIIQFEKSCEEMLDLSVGNRAIASGEAVKVGDKFGLRITAITPPAERFLPVRPKTDSVS